VKRLPDCSLPLQKQRRLIPGTRCLHPLAPQRLKDWEKARDVMGSGRVWTGQVESLNEGGARVRLGSLLGFLPFSHMEPRAAVPGASSAEKMVGTTIKVQVSLPAAAMQSPHLPHHKPLHNQGTGRVISTHLQCAAYLSRLPLLPGSSAVWCAGPVCRGAGAQVIEVDAPGRRLVVSERHGGAQAAAAGAAPGAGLGGDRQHSLTTEPLWTSSPQRVSQTGVACPSPSLPAGMAPA